MEGVGLGANGRRKRRLSAIEAAHRFGQHVTGGPGWWLLSTVLQVVLIAGLVVLAVVAVQRITGGPLRRPGDGAAGATASGPDEALAQLRLRYARGEVSRDEYVQMAADLGAPVPTGGGETPWSRH